MDMHLLLVGWGLGERLRDGLVPQEGHCPDEAANVRTSVLCSWLQGGHRHQARRRLLVLMVEASRNLDVAAPMKQAAREGCLSRVETARREVGGRDAVKTADMTSFDQLLLGWVTTSS